MDIVFVHGNYPAQFRHLAPTLANIKEHRILHNSERRYRQWIRQQYQNTKIRTHRNPSGETHHYLTTTEESILKGRQYLGK